MSKAAFFIALILGTSTFESAYCANTKYTPSAYSHPQKQLRSEKASILYQTRLGNITKAAALYCSYKQHIGHEDFELIKQMAAIMVEQGVSSSEPSEYLLAIYGAGISRNPHLLYILEQGLSSNAGLIQLASLHFLEEFHDDRADQAIHKAMSSPFLPIRLEACIWLAKIKHPKASGYIETLYEKVDPSLRAVFSQLFALCGDPRSLTILRHMLTDSDPLVRLAAIISAANAGCEMLLPQIRAICLHPSVLEQEACAAALGEMQDEASASVLEKMSCCNNENVRLSALYALYLLGRIDKQCQIEQIALNRNLYAITLLGKMSGSEETLARLIKSSDLQVRINATLALLERRDNRCMRGMRELLLKDPRDLLVLEQISPGKSLESWKVVTSAKQQFKDRESEAYEHSIKIREKILAKSADLPINDFLCLVQDIFDSKQTELIPSVVELVEKINNRDCIDFLKLQLTKAGAPLTRQCCNLALYRLKEPGPYAKQLYHWVMNEKHSELIDFQPMSLTDFSHQACYSLSPTQKSRLLIDSLSAIAEQRDATSIETLLQVIAHGNPKNRYALAGLLMRAVE